VKPAGISGIKKTVISERQKHELTIDSKNKNIRDLNREIKEFKGEYQPKGNLMKDENCDLLADSHNILNRWNNYYSVIECT
jgi:hypothetical protein